MAPTPLRCACPARARVASSPLAAIFVLALLPFVVSACDGDDRATGDPIQPNGDARLVAVDYGRLVDVYGVRSTSSGDAIELVRRDVLVSPFVRDESAENEPRWEFLRPDPDTLQSRVLLRAAPETAAWDDVFAALQARVPSVSRAVFGQRIDRQPFPVVPRNAALRLRFSRPLGIEQEFFSVVDEDGRTTAPRNTVAVQLLSILGDPRDGNDDGDYALVPTRTLVRDREIVLDPVLLGDEGERWGAVNQASGMPPSANSAGANMRVAIALEGPLRIRGMREDDDARFTGSNLARQRCIVRDFRSGNAADDSALLARGFLRDAEAPRVAGQILTYLTAARSLADRAGDLVELRVWKDGLEHDLDRGDGVRIVVGNRVVARSEILVEPDDDRGRPDVQTVRIVVAGARSLLELDPRRRPDWPADPAARPAWLRDRAPRVVVDAAFTARRRADDGREYGDDPELFLRFTPSPSPDPIAGAGGAPTEHVSPFASAVVAFTKPIALDSVKALDTFFIATRDVLSPAAQEAFRDERGIDPALFDVDKFATPHLVHCRWFDEDGSQTRFVLRPPLGLYLDERMRAEDGPRAFEDKRFRYYVHLRGGAEGIRDLSGNTLDLGDEVGIREELVVPFSVDTRRDASGRPVFDDNLVVTVARRFASPDEDERPSYYRPDEVSSRVPGTGSPNPAAVSVRDQFGAVVYAHGRLLARPTGRVRRVVDAANQGTVPPQGSPLQTCPEAVRVPWIGGPIWDDSIASRTAATAFPGPVQNPLNPFGCRMHMCWREIDMTLSRIDPNDFDLDVEAMYWMPYLGRELQYDEFDSLSLFLGHGEFRPVPCVGDTTALPTLPNSGLRERFADNWANDPGLDGRPANRPDPVPAFRRRRLVIDPSRLETEPNGGNGYFPLPAFEQPYFVWRDQTATVQGGATQKGHDTRPLPRRDFEPYLLSPFLNGRRRAVELAPGGDRLRPVFGTWNNLLQFGIERNAVRDRLSGGGVGAIALPLLAELQVFPDDPDLPVGNPFLASGANGWQVSLSVGSSNWPAFRTYSGGFRGLPGQQPIYVDPSKLSSWNNAQGGYQPDGTPTMFRSDNTVYWLIADFLKRQTVSTFGFVDLLDPHRVGVPSDAVARGDPRLGPYFVGADGVPALPAGVLPRYDYDFEFGALPSGTSVRAEFRAAGAVDSAPWRAAVEGWPVPRADDVPLDPLKAGDAGLRKFDDRAGRTAWTYPYHRNVTDYTLDPNQLTDAAWLRRFAVPGDGFTPSAVRSVNWRFVLIGNPAVDPPVDPSVESFSLSWRFESRAPR